MEHTQDPEGKTYTYRYDAQGNTLGDGENTYLYDCLNRIAEVQIKAGDIQKNHYDAEGLRSQMEENGKLVSFVYADREVITEEDEAGAHIRYIRGHELLASDSAHARTYYHYACDEMGSITDITDCDGTVLNHYAYDAFGNRTVEEETVENRFGFAGEMLDAVTGQYYLRARFYNPVIARFLSEDTYYGEGLNLHAYCHNNPVRYVDPSGHEGLICSKKYGELKKKEAEGGTLSEKEKRQIYEYEQNQKKSNGAGSDSKSGSGSVKNWKGQEVKIPDGHIMSPRDPSFSAKPITEAGPYTSAQRDAFLDGNSAGTKLAPHHRHQIPVRDGGVIDELPGPGHPSGNQHTAGSPSRHPAKSIFNSESGGNVLRANEITQHWIDKGNRLIEVEPGVWIDPGF